MQISFSRYLISCSKWSWIGKLHEISCYKFISYWQQPLPLLFISSFRICRHILSINYFASHERGLTWPQQNCIKLWILHFPQSVIINCWEHDFNQTGILFIALKNQTFTFHTSLERIGKTGRTILEDQIERRCKDQHRPSCVIIKKGIMWAKVNNKINMDPSNTEECWWSQIFKIKIWSRIYKDSTYCCTR